MHARPSSTRLQVLLVGITATMIISSGCSVESTNTNPDTTTRSPSRFASTFDPRAMAAAVAQGPGGAECAAPPAMGVSETTHGNGTSNAEQGVLRGSTMIPCKFEGSDRELVRLWSVQLADRLDRSDVTIGGSESSDGVTDDWSCAKSFLDGAMRLKVLPNGTDGYWLRIDVREIFVPVRAITWGVSVIRAWEIPARPGRGGYGFNLGISS